MKKKPLNRFDLKRIFAVMLDTCLTKKSSACFIIFATLIIASCSPKTSNTYNTTQNGNEQSPLGNSMTSNGSAVSNGGGSTGDGGGGQGVLCKNTKDSKIRNQLFVRDIYEAIYNHGRTLKIVASKGEMIHGVSDEALSTLVKSIQQIYGPASPNLEFTKKKYWSEFIKKISFLDETRQLFTSQDANSPIALPPECELVQIAYWDESSGNESGTLFVSKPLWDKLDQINKIGLLAHELFFKQARKAGYRNSDMVRFKIGQLLSNEVIPSIFQNWQSSTIPGTPYYLPEQRSAFRFCSGTSSEDSSAKVQLYQYGDSDLNIHLVVPLLESKTVNFNAFQSSHFILPLRSKKTQPLLDQINNFLLASMIKPYSVALLAQDNSAPSSEDWFSWIGDGSGVSPRQLRKDSLLQLLKEFRTKSSSIEPYFWNGKIETQGASISVGLQDPSYDPAGPNTTTRTLKNPEQLVQALNLKIKRIVTACKDIIVPGEIFTPAVAQLNSEIENSIKDGTYPPLEKWRLFLSNLVNYISNNNSTSEDQNAPRPRPRTRAEKACSYIDNDQLFNKIPYYIYMIKSKSYSEEDMLSILRDEAYNYGSDSKSIVPMGMDNTSVIDKKIIFKQGANSIAFDLTCYDSISTYFKNEAPEKIETTSLIPNKKISMNYNFGSKEEPLTRQEIDDIKLLTEYLSGNLGEQPLPNLFLDACNPTASEFVIAQRHCADYHMFTSELRAEEGINAYSCDAAKFHDNTDGFLCAALTLKKSNHSYIVRYRKMQNENGQTYPDILLVRLIPPFKK